MLFNALTRLPELTPVPNVNDDAAHERVVLRANDAIDRGSCLTSSARSAARPLYTLYSAPASAAARYATVADTVRVASARAPAEHARMAARTVARRPVRS